MPDFPITSREIRSKVTRDGQLELSLATTEVPAPGDDQVVVRVGATPINPSDLGLLFGLADMSTAKQTGTADAPVVTADIPPHLMRMMEARVDQSLAVGNEGAGEVIAAGASDAAQALLGKTVGLIGGGMYAEYRVVGTGMTLPLNEGTTAAEGASCFVNPLTALGMSETMRMEGHTAIVHTAAASNLGQMLNRLCIADGIPLVNVVRRDEQAKLLTDQGAKYVCNSSAPSFMDDLTEAVVATGATIGFDATGGGELAGQILSAMERAANRTAEEYSRYGSATWKQVYIYGSLDRSPTILKRDFGLAWGVCGWLLTPFLQKIGFEAGQKLRQRVAAEIKTTFASRYTQTVSLAGALQLDAVAGYGTMSTGEKYLIDPTR
ncbi:MAG: zinc-binding dehydrogenase [Myxococcota bacterium]|jgi:NADPH:quinone reductase-like Zn-dependent oxidoreductase|nr:zinc-binding dehydrogenase [Myxococcota bacterium]